MRSILKNSSTRLTWILVVSFFILGWVNFGSVWAAMDGESVVGQWITKDNKSVVEVYRCDAFFCIRIAELKEPFEADGSKKVDKNNPDPEKQGRDIIGLVIGTGFQYKGSDAWSNGTIYDPDNGKSYSCKMKLNGDMLNVRGYIGISLIGRTETWQRKK